MTIEATIGLVPGPLHSIVLQDGASYWDAFEASEIEELVESPEHYEFTLNGRSFDNFTDTVRYGDKILATKRQAKIELYILGVSHGEIEVSDDDTATVADVLAKAGFAMTDTHRIMLNNEHLDESYQDDGLNTPVDDGDLIEIVSAYVTVSVWDHRHHQASVAVRYDATVEDALDAAGVSQDEVSIGDEVGEYTLTVNSEDAYLDWEIEDGDVIRLEYNESDDQDCGEDCGSHYVRDPSPVDLGNVVEVKIAVIPGPVVEVVVPANATIADALRAADLPVDSSLSYQLNGVNTGINARVSATARVVVMRPASRW